MGGVNILQCSFASLSCSFRGEKKYQLTCDMEIIRKLIMKRNGSIECSLVVGILLDLSDNVSTLQMANMLEFLSFVSTVESVD